MYATFNKPRTATSPQQKKNKILLQYHILTKTTKVSMFTEIYRIFEYEFFRITKLLCLKQFSALYD